MDVTNKEYQDSAVAKAKRIAIAIAEIQAFLASGNADYKRLDRELDNKADVIEEIVKKIHSGLLDEKF